MHEGDVNELLIVHVSKTAGTFTVKLVFTQNTKKKLGNKNVNAERSMHALNGHDELPKR